MEKIREALPMLLSDDTYAFVAAYDGPPCRDENIR